ncbi:MAG: FkbM family methyltransferase [Lachnospiraceae bacterium]|nr:FkbM family methyltransferase [Lachnospiraceae bacterium]
MDINLFLEKIKNNKLCIYGAGNLGNLLYWYLINKGFRIDKYIVSKYIPGGYYVTNGLPIVSKDDFIDEAQKDNAVIVAIKFQEQIAEELSNYAYKYVYCLDSRDELIIAKVLFDELLSNNNISFQRDVSLINIKGETYVNPYIDDERFLDFFMGGVDMLFPHLFNEKRWINEGPYENHNVYMKKGDVVINCGASIGLFSQIAINRGCFVHAFEPAKKQLEILHKSLSNYNKDMWTINGVALSDKSGEHDFYVHKSFEYDGFYKKKDNIDLIKVHTITLDEYVENNKLEKVDFIKANIEGAERNMLIGAKNILREFAPMLSIRANHLDDDIEVITDIICSANDRYVVDVNYKNIYAYVK